MRHGRAIRTREEWQLLPALLSLQTVSSSARDVAEKTYVAPFTRLPAIGPPPNAPQHTPSEEVLTTTDKPTMMNPTTGEYAETLVHSTKGLGARVQRSWGFHGALFGGACVGITI